MLVVESRKCKIAVGVEQRRRTRHGSVIEIASKPGAVREGLQRLDGEGPKPLYIVMRIEARHLDTYSACGRAAISSPVVASSTTTLALVLPMSRTAIWRKA